MSFRLKEALFKVKCREPGCPFFSEFLVKENIAGITEADVDSELLKIVRGLAYNKHDALFGRKHALANPDITKVSGSYERIGGLSETATYAAPSVLSPTAGDAPGPTRTFRRGETIIRKGDSAATVAEIVRGMAYNIRHPEMPYKQGSTFGAAALFREKSRLADVVAGEDGTVVTFYHLRELSKTNPAKARGLYDEAMEDVFHILVHLEDYSASLEKKVQRLEAAAKASKARPAAKKGAVKKAKKAAPKKGPASKKRPVAKNRPVAKKKGRR